MTKICPVSEKMMNENISRLNGIFTFLFVVSFIISNSPVLIFVLFFDFLLRNIYEGKMSPVIRVNSFIIQLTEVPAHMINAGPKIFAARVGLVFSLLAILLYYFASPVSAMIPMVILGLFSFMEGVFNYCVACKLYPYFLPVNQLFDKRGKH